MEVVKGKKTSSKSKNFLTSQAKLFFFFSFFFFLKRQGKLKIYTAYSLKTVVKERRFPSSAYRKGIFNRFTSDSAKSNTYKFYKMTSWVKLKTKQHHGKVLLKSGKEKEFRPLDPLLVVFRTIVLVSWISLCATENVFNVVRILPNINKTRNGKDDCECGWKPAMILSI